MSPSSTTPGAMSAPAAPAPPAIGVSPLEHLGGVPAGSAVSTSCSTAPYEET